MKKLLLSALSIVAISTASQAQNFFSQDFEDTTDYANIAIFDADGDTNNWGIYDLSASTSTHLNVLGRAMGSQSWDGTAGLNPDNLLILGPINMTTASGTVTLSWDAASSEGATSTFFPEQYSVYSGNGAAGLAASTATPALFNTTLTAGGVVFNETADLSAMAGAGMDSVYVVIRHHNTFDQNLLVVDNISVDAGSGPVSVSEVELNVTTYAFENELFVNSIENLNNAQVNVINAMGQTVESFNANGTTNRYNLSNLSAGMYLVNISSNGNAKTTKITIK